MSNRANKVKVDPHSGAVVEDLKDYINPILRRKPDNIILHIGTNNLKRDKPNEIADKIVEIAETIEENLPDCKIAISKLITRSDSLILEQARKDVNKHLRTFCNQRSWSYIKHDITSQDLNKRGLHLNKRGIGVFAKTLNKYNRGLPAKLSKD